MVGFTVLPEVLAYGFALLSGIGKHEAFFTAGMLKDIAHPRIGSLGCSVYGGFYRKRFDGNRLTFVSLRLRIEEVFHRKPPHFFAAVAFGDNRFSPAACSKKGSRFFRVTECGGKPNPPGIAARSPAEPLDQAKGLPAAVGTQQGVDFIDDDKA